MSPKEIFTFYDAEHLLIANIASPRSVRNIAAKPRVCVSFVDIFVQKGFKVLGVAQNLRKQDKGYAKWVAPLNALAGPRFPILSVIVIRVTACEPINAPSYQLYPHETTLKAQTASAMRAYGVQPVGDRI